MEAKQWRSKIQKQEIQEKSVYAVVGSIHTQSKRAT